MENAHKRRRSSQRIMSAPLLPTPKKLQESIPADSDIKNFKNLGIKPFKKLSNRELEGKKKKGL